MQKHQIQLAHPLRKSPLDFFLGLDEADPRNILNECLHRGQCYESEVAWTLIRAIRLGDTVIDVGANIGFFTMIMADLVGPEGLVYAIEPGDKAREQLNRNIAHNKFEKRVIVSSFPAWCRDEKVTFYNNSDTPTSSALVDPGQWWENVKSRENPLPKKMHGVKLDTLIGRHVGKIRLIKIDTEGGELRVLQGATEIIKTCPYVIVELNPFGFSQFGYDTAELRGFMRYHAKAHRLFFMDRLGGLPAYIPNNTAVKYVQKWQVTNGLFSEFGAVGEAWPEATGVPGEI